MNAYTTLVSAEQLQALITSSRPLRIFDCSFDLSQPRLGHSQYLESHIPSAVYADLDTVLSARHGAPGPDGVLVSKGADAPASGGRHPLPNRERFATWLSSVGFSNDMQAVVYDRNGANYCGRLWWMLKWAGHRNVAVLDGGLQAWVDCGGVVQGSEEPAHFQSNFELGPEQMVLISTAAVVANLGRPEQTIVDARLAARFKGDVEPIDSAAGHIPGALNRPFHQNLQPDGKFKPSDELRRDFELLLGDRAPATVVHQCGSGVSAALNVLAMEIAGFGSTGLYAGSWSDWCSNPSRPVARG